MNRREFIKTLEGIVIASSIPLISGCKKNPVESEPDSTLNSNSIIKDNIKYYMQTDKSVYNGKDEIVEMLYMVTNLGDENVSFYFSTEIQRQFTVEKNGTLVWNTDTDKPGMPTSFTLQTNEFKEFNEIWNLKWSYAPRTRVEPGNYQVIGKLIFQRNRSVPVSVPIEVIP